MRNSPPAAFLEVPGPLLPLGTPLKGHGGLHRVVKFRSPDSWPAFVRSYISNISPYPFIVEELVEGVVEESKGRRRMFLPVNTVGTGQEIELHKRLPIVVSADTSVRLLPDLLLSDDSEGFVALLGRGFWVYEDANGGSRHNDVISCYALPFEEIHIVALPVETISAGSIAEASLMRLPAGCHRIVPHLVDAFILDYCAVGVDAVSLPRLLRHKDSFCFDGWIEAERDTPLPEEPLFIDE